MNENTSGLLRQYIPTRRSMKHLTRQRCSEIALRFNNHPRERYQDFWPIDVLALHLE